MVANKNSRRRSHSRERKVQRLREDKARGQPDYPCFSELLQNKNKVVQTKAGCVENRRGKATQLAGGVRLAHCDLFGVPSARGDGA